MRALLYLVIICTCTTCTKNKQYRFCDENPCDYNTILVNNTPIVFNREIFTTLNNRTYLGFERVISGEFPIRAENISFAGLPDTTGIIHLKKGDAWSGFPVTSYCYFEEDVCIDNSAPYDSTSSWLEIYEMDSTHIQGRAQLMLYRSDNVQPSAFYGDVDTLNISFEFDVSK